MHRQARLLDESIGKNRDPILRKTYRRARNGVPRTIVDSSGSMFREGTHCGRVRRISIAQRKFLLERFLKGSEVGERNVLAAVPGSAIRSLAA